MSFTGPDIRNLRQRLGWSVAEMARQMGCSVNIIQIWENGVQQPDFEAINQLRYLRNQVEMTADHVSQKPQAENEMEKRRVSQVTHRDLLKDN